MEDAHDTCEIDQPSGKTPPEGLATDRPGRGGRGPQRRRLQQQQQQHRASSSTSSSTSSPAATSSIGSTTSGSIVWSASPLSGTGANDARTVLINAFEKQYPGIHVTLVSAPTDTDTNRATLATEISGGATTPDVFMGDVIWPAQFGAHQLAVPLSQYLPASYWSKFAPGLVAGATYKGLVYGSPLFEDQGFLYYRKDLLAKYAHGGAPDLGAARDRRHDAGQATAASSTASSGKATRTRA